MRPRGRLARSGESGGSNPNLQIGANIFFFRKRRLIRHSVTYAIGEPCPSAPVPHCSQQLRRHWLVAMSRKHDRIPEIGHSDPRSRFVCSSTQLFQGSRFTLVLLISNYLLIPFLNLRLWSELVARVSSGSGQARPTEPRTEPNADEKCALQSGQRKPGPGVSTIQSGSFVTHRVDGVSGVGSSGKASSGRDAWRQRTSLRAGGTNFRRFRPLSILPGPTASF